MISAFRLCKTRHLSSAFTGEGARLYGGRWNSPGVPIVYTSSSLSLATLEILVHLEEPELLARSFSWTRISIPEKIATYLDLSDLPPHWAADETGSATRSIGDRWQKSSESAVLAVPSVITPGEWNYLLNPIHSRFPEIEIVGSGPFRPDPRLF